MALMDNMGSVVYAARLADGIRPAARDGPCRGLRKFRADFPETLAHVTIDDIE